MSVDDIQAHETAINEVAGLLLSSTRQFTMRQSKERAEIAIRPLGDSNIAYLLGQAIDAMPCDFSTAGRKIEIARDQLEEWKRNV